MKASLSIHSLVQLFRLTIIALAFIAESLLIAVSPAFADDHALATLQLEPVNHSQREAITLHEVKEASLLSKQLNAFIQSAITQAPNHNALAKSLSTSSQSPTPHIEQIRYAPQGTPRQLKTLFSSSANQSKSLSGDALLQTIADDFLTQYKTILRLDNPQQELSLITVQDDTLGRHYLRYQQQYRGLNIWPAELTVQFNTNNQVDLVNGYYIPTPNQVKTTPTVHQQVAESIALNVIDDHDIAHAELIIHAPANHIPRLAWKIKLQPTITTSWLIFVDALNGNILKQLNQVNHESIEGNDTDLLGEARDIDVWHDSGTYYMIDTTKPMYIADSMTSPPNRHAIQGAIIIEDANHHADTSTLPQLNIKQSTDPDNWGDTEAVSALFSISEAYDYFNLRHNVTHLVPPNESIKAIINFGNGAYDNAFWQPDLRLMVFGDQDEYAASLDIAAHELTHALINRTARLVYENQSGALSEAFADIFGEAAEARTFGSNDWLIGTQLDTPSRNLADPNSINIPGTTRPYPSSMTQYIESDDDFLNQFTNQDYGGVHINSTIISHAFYLLATSIGLFNAERIFFQTLDTQLTSYSQFIDARLGAIAAAEQIFGVGSTEALAVASAFSRVGIHDGTPTPPPSPVPQVPASDSTMYIGTDNQLWRQEGAVGTIAPVLISTTPRITSRPSVSGNGEFVFYIKNDNNLCVNNTTDGSAESCLSPSQAIQSIAVSPSLDRFAYVLSSNLTEIIVVNIEGGLNINNPVEKTLAITAPTTDSGILLNTITEVRDMDFSSSGQYIYFNALNEITYSTGGGPLTASSWSIYSVNIATEAILSVVPPIRGIDFEYPSLGHTSDDHLTFTGYDSNDNITFVYSADLSRGLAKEIAQISPAAAAYPSYNGNDSAIIYTESNNLVRQNVSTIDHTTKDGDPTAWLSNARLGVMYRKGDYHGPNTAPESSIDTLEVNKEDDPDSEQIPKPASGVFDIETGDTITFEGSFDDAEGDTNIQYLWRVTDLENNNVGESFGAATDITFPNRGAFTVKLITTDEFGATDITPDSIVIRVSTSNIAPQTEIISPATSEITVALNQSVTFEGSAFDADHPNEENPPLTYQWTIMQHDTGGNPTINVDKPFGNGDSLEPDVYQFDILGTFQITFTATDEHSLSGSSIVTVHVTEEGPGSSEPIINDKQSAAPGGSGALNFLLILYLALSLCIYARRRDC